jgi:hypothetical protein
MLKPAFRRSLVAAYGGFSQQESLNIKHKGLAKADERIQKLFSATLQHTSPYTSPYTSAKNAGMRVCEIQKRSKEQSRSW